MINKYEIDGVPVSIQTNEAGEVVEALIGDRGQYVVERKDDRWNVVFMQLTDIGPRRSSNCYTQRWFLTKEQDINVIINGLIEDGYFPDCPNWVRNNTYYPDYDAPILERVWSFTHDGPTWDSRISRGKFDAWNREAKEIAQSLSLREQGVIKTMGSCACDMLNILESILHDVEGLRYIDVGGPAKHIDMLDKESTLLCKMLLDVSNEISDLYYDDYISDPCFENPVPDSSCCLEDLI